MVKVNHKSCAVNSFLNYNRTLRSEVRAVLLFIFFIF